MKRERTVSERKLHVAVGALALLVAGCSDSGAPSESTAEVEYLLNVASPTPDGDATSFMVFLEELEVGTVSTDAAREVGGWVDTHVSGGRAFVADGEAPTITSYAVSNDGRLSDEQKLTFASYGASSAGYGLNSYASETRSYFSASALERVIWDPSQMEILGTLTLEGVPEAPETMALNASYDRGVLVRGESVFHSIYTANWDTMSFGPSSIAVWSSDTDETVAVLESGCPMLDSATQDDDGNVYYSPWLHAVAAELTQPDAPKTCAVRVAAGSTSLDPDFSGDLSALVDGRPVINLQYAGNGIFLAGVLHTERLAEPLEVDDIYSPNWRLYRFDLEAQTATLVEGLGWNDGGYTLIRLDGRAYLILSTETEGSVGYELAADGGVRQIFDSPSFILQISQLSGGR